MRSIIVKSALLSVVALATVGCSMGGLLSGKRGIPSDQNVQTGNQLAMPPDLSLASPGSASAPAQQISAPEPVDEGDVLGGTTPPVTRKQAAAANPQADIYEQYGISKFHADGKKKEDWELREELRKAIIARKRKANPGYGTVRNIGGLFSDN